MRGAVRFVALAALLSLGAAFVPVNGPKTLRWPAAVEAAPRRQVQTMALGPLKEKASAVALSFLIASSLLVGAPDDALAARSGGRVGGGARSSSSFRSAPKAAPRSANPRGAGGPTVAPGSPGANGPRIQQNYYSSPGVMVMPPVSPFGFGFGYNPLGGLGTGYALGAMNNGGDRAREYRLESEQQTEKEKIMQLQKELDAASATNSKLEQRLDDIEKKL